MAARKTTSTKCACNAQMKAVASPSAGPVHAEFNCSPALPCFFARNTVEFRL
jgi:hypothetical protein